MGVRSAAVDAMIAAMLRARERADFVAAVRALDRVLMSGSYVVPLFYLPEQWVARWAVHRASGADVAVRLSARDLVAAADTSAAMILGDPLTAAAPPQQGQNRVTIEDVFRRLAPRRPDALALADAPNRETFTDGAPLRLTYAEADRMVSAIAGRLRRMGLPTDAIIGIQLPNTVENILAILGVLRAGMIVAPLPLLWRRADAIAALARIGGKALITCGHVGRFKHCQFAMRVAAEVFSIRYVCGFGKNLPDGVVPFDDLFTAEKLDPIPPLDRERQIVAAAHVAAITFDVGRRRTGAGRAQSSRTAGRRARRPARKPVDAGRGRPLDACPLVVRRHLPDVAAVAPDRRHAAPRITRSIRTCSSGSGATTNAARWCCRARSHSASPTSGAFAARPSDLRHRGVALA